MKRILVYSGTTEGKSIVQKLLEKGIECHVAVATEYGEMVMEPARNLVIHTGRLDVPEMEKLTREVFAEAVIDATHPFAVVVSENIRKSLEGTDIPYYRLLREESEKNNREEIFLLDSVEDAVLSLRNTEGKILLTTGSKELHKFSKDESIKERLVVRVLPGMESLKLCYDCGIEGKNIICMQGPFSLEMNLATIKQYDIKHLVTKESGKNGGQDDKILAGAEAGIPVYVIRRPNEATGVKCYLEQELLDELKIADKIDVEVEEGRIVSDGKEVEIIIAGIGMGSRDSLTVEVRDSIENADLIFGARRMIDGYNGKIGSFPYYLAKDIIPVIRDAVIEKGANDGLTAVILYSGDSGFFSGARMMESELKKAGFMNVRVLPGISSIQALAARFNMSWQDAEIVSTHGIQNEIWEPKLLDAVRYNEKTFFIASGAEDVRRIGELLLDDATDGDKETDRDDTTGRDDVYDRDNSTAGFDMNNPGYEIRLGYKLSYPDEEIGLFSAEQCMGIKKEGLYSGFIVNENPRKRRLTCGVSDNEFLRERVPMTKEEIREISLCKLGLTEGAVLFDIGSGTGSIAIEAALLSSKVKVYAVECKEEAAALIGRNKEKFKTKNVEIVRGMAPLCLDEILDVPSHVFIGGSRGNLRDIIMWIVKNKKDKVRVVLNAITIETLCEMNELAKEMNLAEYEVVNVSVSKAKQVGEYHLMEGNNPIYICSFSLL